MSDEEIERAALDDPDGQPLSDQRLARGFRPRPLTALRKRLGLSQAEFARQFMLNLRTLQDWEQGRREPEDIARNYLRVIERNPDAVRAALEGPKFLADPLICSNIFCMSDTDLFEMANLYPATTGLPMTVWVSPRGGAQHDVRIKVNMAYGNQMSIANTAVVAVRPTPRLIAGQLPPTDMQAVSDWVWLNETALVSYWDGTIDTATLIGRLRRV